MDYSNLLSQAETFARSYFTAHTDEKFVYHNLRHTEKVVKAAREIGNHFQLDEKDYFIVVCAAWFHDLGYFIHLQNHEAESAALARSFFTEKELGEPIVHSICACILATKCPQHPQNLLEKILCDADLFHLGTDDFQKGNKLLRREAALLKGESVSGKAWRRSTIQFMEAHHYWTDYCRLLLNDTKSRHLQKLKEKAEAGKEDPSLSSPLPPGKPKKEVKLVEKRPDRGVETMFRLASSNNQRMSDMADNKAHILVTVNSIILSAIISLVLHRLDTNPQLAIPVYLILTVGVLTIIFSILATRPSITKGTFTAELLEEKKVNLLFFGNFYRMSLEEYTDGMRRMMDDRDFLYSSLIRDVYGQGIVLARKYRLLRISYDIFMYGLIISVIAFIIATYI